MIRIEVAIPGGATDTITDGDIGFALGGSYDTHRLDNGDYCVIAPAGVKVGTSPAFASVGGRMTNGAALNFAAGQSHPFDNSAGDYNAATAHDPAAIIRPGSVLLKMTGVDPAPSAPRDGLTSQWSVLHVVAEPPAPHAVSPAVWTGANRPWAAFDLDAVLSDLPSYAATGDEVSWSSLRPYIGLRDVGGALDGGGALIYQEMTRNGTGLGSSNYGSYLSVRYNKARIGLLSNTWSGTDKAECALALASIGYDLLMARSSAGPSFPVDGGHYHWEPDLMLLALKAIGRADEYADFIPYIGNVGRQPFLHTSETIALLAGHNDLAKPYVSRWRAVTSVASTTQFAVAHSATGDQGDKTRFQGGIAVREGDGAERAITASVQVGPDNAITGWTWTLASPLSGVTVSDRFMVKAPFPISVGQPDWCIRGIATPRTINPLPLSAYRQENEWSMAHRFARALGMVGNALTAWDAYTLHAETGANGLPSPIHNTVSAFIGAHSAAILALPQVV